MKNLFLPYLALILCLNACKKDISGHTTENLGIIDGKEFVKYTIAAGQQYCDKTSYVPVLCSEMKFIVKFDSSAVYQTASSSNQIDVNKLLGFSDNNSQHHLFSARFGWRWVDNSLQIFAYVYNDGTVSMKKLGTVDIGPENVCSIKVSGNSYVFTLNGKSETMARTSTTPYGSGYKLYPYFGGNEAAPHNISIWIKE